MITDHTPAGLTIVIPALNEEDGIGDTIARCLNARKGIKATAQLEFVEIVVVSDGSTDRTADIARSFDEVKVVEFDENRGYGAAITTGFQQGSGDLVGFLDADGTCDPEHFGTMCCLALSDHADIVLGSRMGPGSKMPGVRRLALSNNPLLAYHWVCLQPPCYRNGLCPSGVVRQGLDDLETPSTLWYWDFSPDDT